ncbi:hypothetical protein [Croceimicrobium sp.]|uniref:hypothetical protein n=1 Tax=Croceimicrobium sp. TaxID=2828340 RepID=UPI003BABD03C
MIELGNTPFEAEEYKDSGDYQVFDSIGNLITMPLPEGMARAIAALPDTLREIENAKLKIQRIELAVKHYKEENNQLKQRVKKCEVGTLRKTEMIGELRESIITAENKEAAVRKRLNMLEEAFELKDVEEYLQKNFSPLDGIHQNNVSNFYPLSAYHIRSLIENLKT